VPVSADTDSVHVDEVYTEVVTHAAQGRAARSPGLVPGAAEAGWSETRGRLDWIETRTRAEGFDD
jgi:hypothetical protein